MNDRKNDASGADTCPRTGKIQDHYHLRPPTTVVLVVYDVTDSGTR